MTNNNTQDYVRRNRVVYVDMQVFDGDGQLLQSTEAEGPFAYLHGHGNLIKKLETALEGLKPGDRCEVEVSPVEGYGDRLEDAVTQIPQSALADNVPLEVGTRVSVNGPDGQMEFSIVAFEGEQVTLDANHPLAGKQLTFKLQVVSARPAHKDEIKHRRPHPAGHHLMVDDSSYQEL